MMILLTWEEEAATAYQHRAAIYWHAAMYEKAEFWYRMARVVMGIEEEV